MLRIRITVLILAVTLGFSAQAGRVVVDSDGNRYDLQSKDHEECAVDVCCNGNECSNPSSCCDKELHCMVTEVQKRDNLGNVYLSKKGKCGVEKKQLEKIQCAVDVCCNGNECSNPSSCCDKELHCMVTEVQKRDNLGNVYLSKKGKCGVEKKQLEKIRELSMKNLLQRQYRASDFQNPSVKTHLRQNQGAAAALAGP